jgi:peptidyl-prolyl cis-trans isomerase C
LFIVIIARVRISYINSLVEKIGEKMKVASARHILVEDEQKCIDLKNKILAGEDFGALAKDHSRCPSGAKGGALGHFNPGQMVPEFDKVVFSAPINEVQGPVKTQFGYHLLEVTSRAEE